MVEDFLGGLKKAKLKEGIKRKLGKYRKYIKKEVKKGKYVSVFPELRVKEVKKKKRKRKRVKKIVYFK